MRRFPLVPAMICVLLGIGDGMARVRVEETTVTLPTYPPGPYDKNPIFYTGRVYQGAQGRVYPYPLQDTRTIEGGSDVRLAPAGKRVSRDDAASERVTHRTAVALYLKGLLALAENRSEEAKKLFGEALKERPDLLWARYFLSR